MQDSTIDRAAAEFHGAVAVLVGYAAGTRIEHNEIRNLTYGAISVGWGWGTRSYARNNRVVGNRIRDYKLLLNDGGCIYTLSAQPGTLIERNW